MPLFLLPQLYMQIVLASMASFYDTDTAADVTQ